jgi:hypothetical protein
LAECPVQYAVFVDSDMRFRRDGWLRDLVDAAVTSKAALVTSRIQRAAGATVGADGSRTTWLDRPTPWLMLVDVTQVRGVVQTGFGYQTHPDPDDPSAKLMYDTGASFLEDLIASGLAYREMGDEWSRCYQHFGGMTWIRDKADLSLSRRIKMKTRGVSAWTHLQLERFRAGSER